MKLLLKAAGIISLLLVLYPSHTSADNFKEWAQGPVMDQGGSPMCVGYAWVAWLQSGPDAIYDPTPLQVYRAAQLLDVIDGTDYEGTTTEGGAAAMALYGYLGSVAYTADPREAALFIKNIGPVIVQSAWHYSMDYPQNGYVFPTGAVRSYHEYECFGVDDNDNFLCRNSWGTSFGVGGDFLVSFHSMVFLLQEGGEIAMPTKNVNLSNPGSAPGSR